MKCLKCEIIDLSKEEGQSAGMCVYCRVQGHQVMLARDEESGIEFWLTSYGQVARATSDVKSSAMPKGARWECSYEHWLRYRDTAYSWIEEAYHDDGPEDASQVLMRTQEELHDRETELRIMRARCRGQIIPEDNGIIWDGEYDVPALALAAKEMLSHYQSEEPSCASDEDVDRWTQWVARASGPRLSYVKTHEANEELAS